MFPSNLHSCSYPKPRRSPSDVIRWMVGRRLRFSVKGKSMLPTLQDGVFVFVDPQRNAQKGDIAVLYHPHQKDCVLIKRCIDISNEHIWVEGDNPSHSTDSRQWGWIPLSSLIGTCTSIL